MDLSVVSCSSSQRHWWSDITLIYKKRESSELHDRGLYDYEQHVFQMVKESKQVLTHSGSQPTPQLAIHTIPAYKAYPIRNISLPTPRTSNQPIHHRSFK